MTPGPGSSPLVEPSTRSLVPVLALTAALGAISLASSARSPVDAWSSRSTLDGIGAAAFANSSVDRDDKIAAILAEASAILDEVERATSGASEASCADGALANAQSPLEARLLREACTKFADDWVDAPFRVLARFPSTLVIARPTGDCGGCGTQVVAAMFDGDELGTLTELGRYGRFGNGPDAVRAITVGTSRALAVDWSEGNHGYWYSHTELHWLEAGVIRPGVCITTSYTNEGAREDNERWVWEATPSFRCDGSLDIRYRVVERGADVKHPLPRPVHLSAKRVRARIDPNADWSCISPDGD